MNDAVYLTIIGMMGIVISILSYLLAFAGSGWSDAEKISESAREAEE